MKKGQTLRAVADGFCTTVYALVAENGLTEELHEGQLIYIPIPRALYTVQAGDTKALLCGSQRAYAERNGTEIFYPGMRARL